MKNFKYICISLAAAVSSILMGCASTKDQQINLQQMVDEGRNQEVKSYLTPQYDIDAQDEEGNTLLHVAAKNGNVNMIVFLLKNGANPNIKNFKNELPLHIAINQDKPEAASLLVNGGSNIFARTLEGKTAIGLGFERNDNSNTNANYYDVFINDKTAEYKDDLTGKSIVHIFVEEKNEKAIQTCIKQGIPLSLLDFEGLTPLDYAFKSMDDDAVVRIAANLIKNGADREKSSDYDYFRTCVINRNMNYRFEDGQTPLHFAAVKNHKAIAKFLLDEKNEQPARKSAQDGSGATPLHEAVRYGSTDVVTILLEAKADTNARDNMGKTPILLAMPSEKAPELYNQLIGYGADVQIKDTYGDTVLHMATMTNVSVDTLGILTRAGADINSRNKDGIAPLALAIDLNNDEHIRFYAERGCDINSKDTKGNTPLTLSFKYKEDIPDTVQDKESARLNNELKILKVILNEKNIDTHDSNGNTPLLIAIQNDATQEQIRYILSMMEDVNQRNSEGNTALYMAVMKNRKAVGEMLLEKNADIFIKNTKNKSPLSLALNAGGSLMNWLITDKTIRDTDGSGNTALFYAAEWELKDAIKHLVDKGAEPDAKNANGETPIFSAAKVNNTEILDQLVKYGCNVKTRDNLGGTALHMAVRWGNSITAKKLIDLGCEIDAQNVNGKAPLSEAASAGKLELAKLLLENNANINISDTNGRTIIMDAVKAQNINIIKLFLENKANPHVQDINGRNAYHEAALTGNVAIINLIRSAGADPLSRDKNGTTPFSMGIKSNNDNVIFAILGDDITITDSDGNTPLHVAVQNVNAQTKPLLEKLIDRGYPMDSRNANGFTPLATVVEQYKQLKDESDYFHDNSGKLPPLENVCELLLRKGANPFVTMDRKGTCAVSMAMDCEAGPILDYMVQYAGTKTDIQGNSILHYSATHASKARIQELLKKYEECKYDTSPKNISGETPADIAERWDKKNHAKILGNGKSSD